MQCRVYSRWIAVIFWKIRGAIIKHQLRKKREVGIIIVIIMKTCHSNFHLKFICKTDKIHFNSALRRGLTARERR